ncbi:hypothetical protein V8C35DRAFT_303478, partial [Trichoderma chlorosporum]
MLILILMLMLMLILRRRYLLPGLSDRSSAPLDQPTVTLHGTNQLEPAATKSRWPEPAPVAMPSRPRRHGGTATRFGGRVSAVRVLVPCLPCRPFAVPYEYVYRAELWVRESPTPLMKIRRSCLMKSRRSCLMRFPESRFRSGFHRTIM